MVEDTAIFPVMTALGVAVAQELVKRELPEATYTVVQPGAEFVVDYAGGKGSCGEIDVNLVQAFPTDTFPEPDVTGNCVSALAFELNVSVMRCAPQVRGTQTNPIPPTVAEQLEATRLHLADMQAIRCAIKNVMTELEREYVLQAFLPNGPQGQVMGGTWVVLVRSP